MPFSMFWLRAYAGALYPVIFLRGKHLTSTSDNGAKTKRGLKMHDRLHEWTRIEQARDFSSSEVIIDIQGVKRAAWSVKQCSGLRCEQENQRMQAVCSSRYIGSKLAGCGHPCACRTIKRVSNTDSSRSKQWAKTFPGSIPFGQMVVLMGNPSCSGSWICVDGL